MNTKTTAIDTYLARTAAIHAKLERLQQILVSVWKVQQKKRSKLLPKY